MIFAIDFDGTIVKNEFPKIGEVVPGAFKVMNELQKQNHKIILYTIRQGDHLQEAARFCEDGGINFIGVNQNPSQKSWNTSEKVYANFYIMDSALGCPLITPLKNKPYVDWLLVRSMLVKRGLLGREYGR